MSIGVYALIFPDGEVYIGSTTKSFLGRCRSHLRGLRKGSHHNLHMQRLFNKYGEPEFRVLEKCEDHKIVVLREQAWMDAQDQNVILNMGPAYPNPMFGKSFHHSEETRKKIGEANRKRHLSEETKMKLSKSLKGHPPSIGFTGKHHSEESKQKLSKSLCGRSLSNAHRKKISETMKKWWENHG